MGQEILYCYKCQTRLLGSEFEKGKAFKVGGNASCPACVKDLLGSVPETAYETDRGRKLQSTSRIPVQASESGSGKWKASTARALAAPPPAPPKGKPAVVIGAVVAVLVVLVLLAVAMSSSSSTRRFEPPPPPPAPIAPPLVGPAPPPPPPPSVGFAPELRELDEKLRSLSVDDCKAGAACLESARKRRNTPEWLSEIDLRIAQIEGRVRGASLPLRDKAIEAQKKSNADEVNSLRARVVAWGFPSIVDEFNKALAEAAAAPPPPPPPPPPTPVIVDPNAPPVLIYNDSLGPGVMNHSWDGVVDFKSTKKVYSGSRAIAFTLTKKWGAVYLGLQKPVDVARYPYLAFSLLVDHESPMLSVTLWGPERGNTALISIEKLGGLGKPGEWKRFVVPVAPFNVQGGMIHSIVFQAGRITTEPLLYLDQIVFLPTAEEAAPPPPPVPAVSNRWMSGALKAAARDYEGAQKEMEDAADLDVLKLAAQVPVEAGKILEKWSKGQKARLDYLGPNGEHLVAEGSVVSADPIRVTISREDGPVDVPICEILPSSLAELFRNRADRKPQDARAAAAFCAFEGDVDGVKKYSGENAALPEKYLAFAQKRAVPSEAEAAARRLFWSAESEFAAPKRRIGAIEKYASLQSGPELARLRPYITARLDAAKETLLLGEDLNAAGTFVLSGSLKVDVYWLSNADSPPEKARENYVEAEFYAFPGVPQKAWVWAGGCCQETFEGSWQASGLTMPNPKNSKEFLSCEPGSESAPVLKISSSLRKWHAQHGGLKEPARWEWIPLALPKYETAGPKKIRILTSQQGFSVAAIFVSTARREPPRDSDIKELEKAHVVSRKAGGNEPPGNILHEWWWNIDGETVQDLLRSPAFQGKPSGTALRDIFEGPQNMGDRYGARMRGFVHAPVTGAYTFWIATDDGGELFLSADESPLKKRSIATCPTAAGVRDWTRHPSCKSAPILLTGGKRYYIEALQKEGGGGDHLAVGWTLPDGTDERPIPGKRLSPWSNSAPAPAVSAAAPTGATLYRAVALNSPAAMIDGRRWEGKGAPDVSTSPGFDIQNVPLSPPVDATKATMIRSFVFTPGGTWVKMERVPAGNYQVYLIIWEDNFDQTMDLFVQGKEVMKGYHSGEAGHWDRLGPWPAIVTNGTLEVRSTGGDANFSGLEVWKAGK